MIDIEELMQQGYVGILYSVPVSADEYNKNKDEYLSNPKFVKFDTTGVVWRRDK